MDPVVSWVPFEVTLWIGYGFSFLSRKLSGQRTNTFVSCSFRGSYLDDGQILLFLSGKLSKQ